MVCLQLSSRKSKWAVPLKCLIRLDTPICLLHCKPLYRLDARVMAIPDDKK